MKSVELYHHKAAISDIRIGRHAFCVLVSGPMVEVHIDFTGIHSHFHQGGTWPIISLQ